LTDGGEEKPKGEDLSIAEPHLILKKTRASAAPRSQSTDHLGLEAEKTIRTTGYSETGSPKKRERRRKERRGTPDEERRAPPTGKSNLEKKKNKNIKGEET